MSGTRRDAVSAQQLVTIGVAAVDGFDAGPFALICGTPCVSMAARSCSFRSADLCVFCCTAPRRFRAALSRSRAASALAIGHLFNLP